MKIYYTNSSQETQVLAEEVASILQGGDVIAYRGSMGAGKTTFTRGLAKGLGLGDVVYSPTFALVNEYQNEKITLYHFDMFRIEGMDSLYSIGYFDYLDSDAIIAIEWSENISEVFDEKTIFITLEDLGDDKRKITIEGGNRF